MENSAKTFEKAIDKAFSSVKLNSDLMADAMKYKGMVKEVDNEIESNEATGSGSSGQYSQPLFSKEETNETKDSSLRKKIKSLLKDSLGKEPSKEEVDKVYVKVIEKLYKKKKEEIKKSENKESSYEKSAKRQFAKDLQSDKDYMQFKKNAKYDVDGKEFTFGSPNASSDDFFINKRKYSRVGKSDDDSEKIEATEATGSGSVGAYETPAAWAKSPSKKDSDSPEYVSGKKSKKVGSIC